VAAAIKLHKAPIDDVVEDCDQDLEDHIRTCRPWISRTGA